jgi:hypothetical protein
MRDHDAALDQAIREVTAILGDALVRLLFPDPAVLPVDFPDTESPQPFMFHRIARRIQASACASLSGNFPSMRNRGRFTFRAITPAGWSSGTSPPRCCCAKAFREP